MFVLLSSVYTWAGATACLYFFFTAKLLDRLEEGGNEGEEGKGTWTGASISSSLQSSWTCVW